MPYFVRRDTYHFRCSCGNSSNHANEKAYNLKKKLHFKKCNGKIVTADGTSIYKKKESGLYKYEMILDAK